MVLKRKEVFDQKTLDDRKFKARDLIDDILSKFTSEELKKDDFKLKVLKAYSNKYLSMAKMSDIEGHIEEVIGRIKGAEGGIEELGSGVFVSETTCCLNMKMIKNMPTFLERPYEFSLGVNLKINFIVHLVLKKLNADLLQDLSYVFKDHPISLKHQLLIRYSNNYIRFRPFSFFRRRRKFLESVKNMPPGTLGRELLFSNLDSWLFPEGIFLYMGRDFFGFYSYYGGSNIFMRFCDRRY